MSGIPNTWTQVRLGDIVDILDSRRVPVNSDERAKRIGTIPYYGATGQVGTIDTHLFDEELVLLGEDGAPFFDSTKNKAYLVSGRSWVNNHAHVLRAKNGILNSFVLHQLNIADYRTHVSGSTRLKLPQGTMVEIPCVVAPAREQERIVAALDERLSDLDASVASLERAERNLVRYRAAVLAAACSGRLVPTEADLARRAGRSYEPADQLLARILTERRKANTKAKYEEPAQPDTSSLPKLPEGWAWASPELLTSDDPNALAIGPFGSNLKVSDYTDSGVRLVFVRNITQESFTDTKAKYVSKEKAEELAAHRVLPGDILITKMGDPPGDSCLYPDHLSPGIITSDCIRLSPRRTHLSTQYLLYSIRSRFVQQQILAITKGVAQLKVSLGRFCSIVIPLPPLAEQEHIVAEVDRHLSRADALAATIAQTKRRAQRLRRAILATAFQGRLVPQDPHDEPASVLLERIRAEAAATPAPAPRRGRPPVPARAAEAAATYDAPAPKRRGRPPGSKNRPKT